MANGEFLRADLHDKERVLPHVAVHRFLVKDSLRVRYPIHIRDHRSRGPG